jgi:hypothetical protein
MSDTNNVLVVGNSSSVKARITVTVDGQETRPPYIVLAPDQGHTFNLRCARVGVSVALDSHPTMGRAGWERDAPFNIELTVVESPRGGLAFEEKDLRGGINY